MGKPRRDQARHTDTGVNKWSSLTVCPACGKRTYPDRKAAKAASKALYPEDHLSPYRCRSTKDVRPTPAPWHVGHLDERIMTGELDRRDAYDPKQYHPKPGTLEAIRKIAKASLDK